MNFLSRLAPHLRFVLLEFGPLIIFWVLALSFGAKAAIAGSVAYIIADALWRYSRRIPVTRLYIFSSTLTVMFGAIDLVAVTPFMLKYESVITNIATGAAFVIGARGAKPMLQELSEKQRNMTFPEGADVRRFFQLFTLLWAVYFFIKAAFYYWLGLIMPLTEAMALRSVLGSASLALMIALSVTQGRRLFMVCRRLGLLPEAPERKVGA
ncbi:septation protein IspZ [Methylocapsa sp. S129]|uniref:septation protein IspZ n=1 Tax=Methylocapsa sp. S129 TaxID=1641869 RepID=UPI0021105DBF|nr:septation protein IspZ [Methylocapsa sp. S129]